MESERAFPYRIGPYYIPDQVRTPEAMHRFLHAALPHAKQVFEFDGIPLLCWRLSANEMYFFTHWDGELQYFMRLNKMRPDPKATDLPAELQKRAAYQSSVWRSTWLSLQSRDFAKSVFWKYLASPTRVAVSDSSQSTDGEKFWAHRISEALSSGSRVYGLHCEEKAGILVIEKAVQLTAVRQMTGYYTQEQDYAGHYRRLGICI